MAAAVAQARQCVVLGQDADPRLRPTATPGQPAAQGRVQAAHRVLHRVPVAGQGLGHPAGRLALLEGRLRVGMDPVRQLEDLGPVGFDRGRDPSLGIGERLGWGGGIEVECRDGHGCSFFSGRRTGSPLRPRR